MVKEISTVGKKYQSDKILIFDTMGPEIFQSPQTLETDLMSLYPPFYDEGILYILKEETGKFHP